MARRTSLLPEQKDFLLSKVAGFREAQKDLSAPAFLAIVYIEWFKRWPITLSDTTTASGDASSSDRSEADEEYIAICKGIRAVSTLLRRCKENHAYRTLENKELVL